MLRVAGPCVQSRCEEQTDVTAQMCDMEVAVSIALWSRLEKVEKARIGSPRCFQNLHHEETLIGNSKTLKHGGPGTLFEVGFKRSTCVFEGVST